MRPFSIAFAVSLTISLVGKLAADAFLHERIPIFGSFLGLELVENRGVAFGIAIPSPAQELLIGAALLLVLSFAWKGLADFRRAVGFGLILGGALANILDRTGDHLVTDFFQVWGWPVFNLADISITVGVFLLLLCGITPRSYGEDKDSSLA